MKKTKFSRFFESLIYFILLTIPLISVFARVIYVQSNKNAKDSYDDYSYSMTTSVTTNNFDSLVPNTNAFLHLVAMDDMSTNAIGSQVIYFHDLTIDNVYLNKGRLQLGALTGVINGYWLGIFDYDTGAYIRRFPINDNVGTYQFYIDSISPADYYHTNTMFDNSIGYFAIVSTQNYLSNAFDYGLQKTIDDFGNGNINFLNWFGTMFSNNNNLLYINFVNMYLNYALWVSVGYLIYYFLNWFVRFVRETLDNLIYKETKN